MSKNIAKIEKLIKDNFGQEWEIGISTLTYPHDPVKAINELLDAEVTVNRIEVALGRRVKFGGYLEDLLTLKKRHGLEFSVHVPFLYDDLAHPHPEIRKVHVSEVRKTIELADLLGASWVVVHPGHLFFEDSLPTVDALDPLREPRELYLQNASSSIAELVDYPPLKDIDMCIENLPSLGQNKKEIEKLIPNSSRAQFLMDFGHANIPKTTSDLLSLKPHRFHLHDNKGKQDQHLKLGAGNLDLTKLIRKMLDYGGKKIIILELYNLSDALESLNYLEKIARE